MSVNMQAGDPFTPMLSGGVLVAGAGVSGLGTAKLLRAAGVDFAVADDDATKRAAVQEKTGCATMDTAEAAQRATEFPLVVTSPGWRPDSPLLVAASDVNCTVIGDVELCYLLDQHRFFGPSRDWLVVTGTNGKTTTTGMLAAIMEEASSYSGKRAAACGNIGIAVADALMQTPRIDVLVAELSSFQLHWSHELTPDAGVLLNLADDHIDWHGSFDAYAEAKAKVFSASTAVAGVDDEQVVRFAAQTGRSDIIGFTLNAPDDNQVGVIDGNIVSRIGDTPTRISLIDGIEPAGEAGILDALAATAVAVTRGASPEQIDRALHSYQVSGHRGAVVHRAGGVAWIDNSKATNPHAADSALNGTAGKIVWIAGGQLKGADVDQLVRDHAHQFRAVALLGVDRDVIAGAVDKNAPDVNVFVTDSSDPVTAMNDVVRFASEQAKEGDSVILAPAAASLDMYSGMAQRGNLFADAARALAENG
ncbi:UDP-N-acetylmuramoyl-L-alanine--D-glutamate ligase [Corynebacterium genitalium ATCC 33030]|uniref:UDP-N-acetylmuramoylalanine--D-glutamate ligase n=1 Tax=Corynebacterium genitalium ATCC 33030 TaxID=585529 RepID=D7WEM1_9CORY|nr:UDP-N-acetylmuramoyl-L-alanine--D-glutamate ligase [Corynebacterium genitalium]EFK53598.1 UDP-N-acetylmuramoyl-L-alanine--D-glutamate ligase [Corynebacterium genitalium ATCC 33030]UUA88822.1 UDP-N-acetylmuramoyl-L-alanine--D-glutamate ligase [Corynebacterium genitalium ATCC 33030]